MLLNKFRKVDLDFFLLFRFIGAVLVVRQHIHFPPLNLQILNFNLGYLLVGAGFSGDSALVFFFFLTSYLISKNFFNNRYKLSFEGVKDFYLKRVVRVAPLYYFLTAFTIFFVYPYLMELIHLTNSFYVIRLLQIFTFTYYQIAGLPNWNQVYWAISLEMTFYAVVPFLIFVAGKLLGSKIILIASFISVLFLNLIPLSFYPVRHNIIDFGLVFLSGLLFAKILKSFSVELNSATKFFQKNPYLFVCISSIILYSFLTLPIRQIFSIFNPNGVIAFAVVLFVFAVEIYDNFRVEFPEDFKKRFVWQIFNYLGVLSYAIFLSHMLFVVRLNQLYRQFLFARLGESVGGAVLLLIVLLFVIPASIFLYEVIEKPASKFILKNLPKNSKNLKS